MKLKKGPSGESFPRLEEGTYMSRIVQIIGLGENLRDDRFPEKGDCDKVLFTVEYPTELIDINGENKPRFQSKSENMFLTDRANLVKIIKAADPSFDVDKMGDDEEFDFNTLLSKPVMTTIGSTKSDKPKITAFTSVVKGLTVPDQISDSVLFDFYEPDLDVFNSLMDWVQKEIKSATNYEGSELQRLLGEDTGNEGGAAGADMGEDVPFSCMV
jgi:hypothetical protein